MSGSAQLMLGNATLDGRLAERPAHRAELGGFTARTIQIISRSQTRSDHARRR